MHIHFGMSGAFKVRFARIRCNGLPHFLGSLPCQFAQKTVPLDQTQVLSLPGPDTKETTRLAMHSKELGLVCHLSAMTVAHGPAPDLFNEKAAKLGPDPLREDADKEALWATVQRSKKPIGLVLMSQDLVAGIGNIYR